MLETSVDSIAKISGGTLLKYVSCTYQKYLVEKEFRAKLALAGGGSSSCSQVKSSQVEVLLLVLT